jgi:hypothetical protein
MKIAQIKDTQKLKISWEQSFFVCPSIVKQFQSEIESDIEPFFRNNSTCVFSITTLSQSAGGNKHPEHPQHVTVCICITGSQPTDIQTINIASSKVKKVAERIYNSATENDKLDAEIPF